MQIWLIFTHLKLWAAEARHNFKWVYLIWISIHLAGKGSEEMGSPKHQGSLEGGGAWYSVLFVMNRFFKPGAPCWECIHLSGTPFWKGYCGPASAPCLVFAVCVWGGGGGITWSGFDWCHLILFPLLYTSPGKLLYNILCIEELDRTYGYRVQLAYINPWWLTRTVCTVLTLFTEKR